MRRISIFAVLALIVSVVGIGLDAGPAWANSGASRTVITVDEGNGFYGETITLGGFVQDVSASCGSDCDTPKGDVDFWAAPVGTDFELTKRMIATSRLTLGVTTGFARITPVGACCLAPGNWLIRGFYVPDIGSSSGNFEPSSGDDNVTIDEGWTITELTQSSTSTGLGQPVTFTATVSHGNLAANAARPTGAVSFVETLSNGAITYGTAFIDSTLKASITTSSMTAGSHVIRARYAGDSLFNGSTGGPLTHTVNKLSSTGTLTASATNPTYGDSVTFTDSVSPTSATGLVTFSSSLTGTIGSGSLAGGGGGTNIIRVSTAALTGGTHAVTATYAGDSNVNGNTSNSVTVNVARAGTTTRLTPSPSASVFGQSVTFTATVVGPGPAKPGGTVQFKADGANLGAPATLANGVASLATTALAVGDRTITAVYSGDGNYNTSSSGDVAFTVSKASTTTAIQSSPNPSALGDLVTITATVSVVAPGGGTPTGAVQFMDGTRALGGPRPLSGGVASFSTKYLGAGTHTITAEYAGSTSYEPSSATGTHTVVCTRTYSGSLGSLSVPSSGSTCLSEVDLAGGLEIPSGARVSIVSSMIRGGVRAPGGAAGIAICGSSIGRDVVIKGATDFVLLGDTEEEGCTGNFFGGNVTLTANSGGLNLGNSWVSGAVLVKKNVGPGPAGHTSPEVEGNYIRGALECGGNDPRVSNDGQPNMAGSRKGECGAAGF